MKYDFITIDDNGITGVINPLLYIRGTITVEKYEFIVEADNEEVDYTIMPLNNSGSFIIQAELPKYSKSIKAFVKVKGKKHLILKAKSSQIRRVISKAKGIIKPRTRKIVVIFKTIHRGIKFAWREYHFLVPPTMFKKYTKYFFDKIKYGSVDHYLNPLRQNEYLSWVNHGEKIPDTFEEFKYNPLISILIPVYNIDCKYLSECIDSILNQVYKNFEVCLVDDCSTNKETIDTLKEYAKKDKRIKVSYRKTNGHISNTTNDALKLAKGEFVGLVDNDDVLSKHALYEVVKVLNENKDIDMLYSDEDKLDLKGNRCEPHFKPDWSPDTLLSMNYICHFTVLRKKIIDEIGGFTVGLEGAQDYDLFLRFTEKTNKIYHINKILYHWRKIEGSTSLSLSNKSYANDKGKIALEKALERRKIKGRVEPVNSYYRIVYEYDKEPLISIIIPTRDYADTLRACLESIYNNTNYKNYEIIIANNSSVKEETFKLFKEYKRHKNFFVVDINIDFNYSRINNLAVKEAKGEYILLLNNDTEVITRDWLKIMVGYAMQNHIGTVGPKLFYPDMSVQHGGVILGLGGVASHAFLGSPKEDLGFYSRLVVPYDYSAVTAACLMISKKKYEEVNGLDEDLQVAYNDVDFNMKLLKKGYYNVFLPQVELIHFESKSRGLDTTTEKYKRFIEESKYMNNKWGQDVEKDIFYNQNLSKKGGFLLDKKNIKK